MAPPSKRKSGAAADLSTAAHVQDGQSSSTSPLADVVDASRANDPLPVIKVNKVNIAEIKTALDDIVKKHLSNQSFTPSLLHPTVHLSLGYGSILFALGGMAYTNTYKMEFKESRPALVVAVVGYFTLQTLLWAWKRWVEQGEVFSGRRRRLVKRIETDQVQITSSTSLSPPLPSQLSFSPHTRPSSPPNGSPRPGAIDISSPISPVSPIAGTSYSSAASLPHSRDTSSSTSTSTSASSSGSGGPATPPTPGESSAAGPTYILQIELSTTSNNGKSLLHKARSKNERSIADFVDEEGGVEEGQFGRWLDGLLGEAGLVGAEDEGVKNE